jgi:DNA polymerase (family 10)
LHRAALDQRIRTLPGCGAKLEETILDALKKAKGEPARGRMKLATAASYADALTAHLRKAPGVGKVIIAGSYRRGRETVGDIDILATAADGAPVVDHFAAFDQVRDVLASGPTRGTIVLKSGLQVDLRVVPEASYGAALHYFTGSKAHNIAVRKLALKKGLKLSEYGVFRGKRMVAGATEESVYATVGLPYIPPELREDQGEIEAAKQGTLPTLLEYGDLKGDLHAHSTLTDGRNTMREMAEVAAKLGLSYMAVTDHSRSLKMVHGLDVKRLHAQMDAIDRLNGSNIGLTILKGIEIEILEDGSLDLPDDVLARLDLVVGGVHSKFNLSRMEQTMRILRAMENRYLTILAHPSGRLMEQREPYDVDMPQIIAAAERTGCFLELNAHPDRLDLTDVYCRQAKDAGVLISIGSDAHSVDELRHLRFGVQQARRGWLEAKDVLNTRPLGELRRLLKKRR